VIAEDREEGNPMKRYAIYGMVLVLLSFQSSLEAESKPIHESDLLPVQISEFYEGHNFISSFSTKAERNMLIEKYGKTGIREDQETERLRKVFARMARLKEQLSVEDSEMVFWVGPTPKFWRFHFRPVLFDARNIHMAGSSAVVEVMSYEVEPETVLRFISSYDQSNGDTQKIPSLEERMLKARSCSPGKEFHRWILQKGKWRKSVADIFELKEKKY
jgi:hypothetical protein